MFKKFLLVSILSASLFSVADVNSENEIQPVGSETILFIKKLIKYQKGVCGVMGMILLSALSSLATHNGVIALATVPLGLISGGYIVAPPVVFTLGMTSRIAQKLFMSKGSNDKERAEVEAIKRETNGIILNSMKDFGMGLCAAFVYSVCVLVPIVLTQRKQNPK